MYTQHFRILERENVYTSDIHFLITKSLRSPRKHCQNIVKYAIFDLYRKNTMFVQIKYSEIFVDDTVDKYYYSAL